MTRRHEVIETFQITGHGLAAVIDEAVVTVPGNPASVIVYPLGAQPFSAVVFPMLFLCRQPSPVEKSVVLLSGLTKLQVPIGSHIEVVDPPGRIRVGR